MNAYMNAYIHAYMNAYMNARMPIYALLIPPLGPLRGAGKAAMLSNILSGRYDLTHAGLSQSSAQAINFVKATMCVDFHKRTSAFNALSLPWFAGHNMDNKAVKASALERMVSFTQSKQVVKRIAKLKSSNELQRAGRCIHIYIYTYTLIE
jgi:hypothetical protein